MKVKPKGRPRSLGSERAIMDATLDLLAKKSLRELTVEEIAQRAGVGKATIYKWWPTKAYVALAAYLSRMQQEVETADTGSAEADFRHQLLSLVRFYGSPHGRLLGQFIGECQADPAFAATYRERFLEPRRASVAVIWKRGVDRGQIDPGLDCDLVLDLVYAPLVYRLLAGHARFTEADAEQLIGVVFRGIRPRPPGSSGAPVLKH